MPIKENNKLCIKTKNQIFPNSGLTTETLKQCLKQFFITNVAVQTLTKYIMLKKLGIYGTKYSRKAQVKFFKGSI